MLFTSYVFIVVYLPVVLIGFFWIARASHSLAAVWLCVTSLFFYGWWNPKLIFPLLISISFNYSMGYAIGQARVAAQKTWRAKSILTAAVTANLAWLGYFKYTNLFISTANGLAGTEWPLADILLPLGISFFTFTQIAFLVDTYRGLAREYSFTHYLLFVCYFPHLIAGPILHHKQLMPQFDAAATYRINAENVASGMMMFAIGLAKKVILADSFAEYASPVFNATSSGAQPGFLVAWTGALAYTLQLYFDFSAYSDMAVGVSRMFGVKIPLNFNSPYKAVNIIEFWRRWHMTLSQFLRDYLYVPLGGNRLGTPRRHVNLMITMVLGGLWHGASWTFAAWGALHGLYLVANHGWHSLRQSLGIVGKETIVGRLVATLSTFVAVVVGWVLFRAETIECAIRILAGMCRIQDLVIHVSATPSFEALFLGYMVPPDSYGYLIALLGGGLGLVWLAPNTQTFVGTIRFHTDARRFVTLGATMFSTFLLAAINASRGASEFIYFNF